jgi:molybdate transport system permease protein
MRQWGKSPVLNNPLLESVWLTLSLAGVTVSVLLLVGTPLSWWLSRTRTPVKIVLEAFVALPLVLPPTVLGFYLLVVLGPHGWIGGWWLQLIGNPLVFSFQGLVIASCIYSLPFVVQPLQAAVVLGFAHTVGEFGVVLMVGGNIPGETRVISIAIYEHVERLDYQTAHALSAGLLLFSFAVLSVVYTVNRHWHGVS